MARETPFRRSMVGRRTLWGIDYRLAVVNLMLAATMIAVGHKWWWLGIAVLFHVLLRAAYRADPDVFAVYVRYVKQGHRYEPWPHPSPANPRPKGWA